MRRSRGHGRLHALGVAVAAGAVLAALGVTSAGSVNAATCTNSWSNAGGGGWLVGANWSAGHSPTNVEDVCITLAGTYTVTFTASTTVKSLTLGGLSGTQTLSMSNLSPNTTLSATNGIAVASNGAMSLNDGVSVDVASSLFANSGAITTSGSAGNPTILGNLTNNGTMTINNTTKYRASTGSDTLDNHGSITVGSGQAFNVTDGGFVTNGTGGSINASGNGALTMSIGTYDQGAGTTTGAWPVHVQGTLTYSGNGASNIWVNGSANIYGATAPGQSLLVNASGFVTAGGGFTNGGSLIIDSSGTSFAYFMGSVTNNGMTTVQGFGPAIYLHAAVINNGTVNINTDVEFGNAGLLNRGAFNIAASHSFNVNNATVTNDAGGSINASGNGALAIVTGTYDQGAGTTTGAWPVQVAGSLNYTGAGASNIWVDGPASLSGATAPGQTLLVQAGSNANPTAAGGFVNGGNMIFSGFGGPVSLSLGSSTLTNTGTITIRGKTFAPTLTGNIANSGTIEYEPANAGGALNISGAFSQTSSGTIVIGVKGTSASQFDVLSVSGNVTLDGKLALQPSAAYAGAALNGDAVTFLPYGGARSGAFVTSSTSPTLSGTKAYGPLYDDVGHGVSAVVGVPPPLLFHSLSPARVEDPRPLTQIGPYATSWGPGTIRDVLVGGAGGVPAAADAVVLNVTVAGAGSSFLTIWPSGAARPLASSLNWVAGETIPNQVTVKLGAGGRISVYNLAGSADVVVDVAGYYDSNLGDGFTPLTPARVADSRPSSQVGPYATPWGPGTVRELTVGGGVPMGADAEVLNVTVTGASSSFLTIWPSGAPQPTASNLNWVAGETIPNQVTVKLGAGGRISVYNLAGNADVVVDVAGYFMAGTGDSFHSLAPQRVADSRPASQVGPYATPWGPATIRGVNVGGGVPVAADAVVQNVTVTGTTGSFIAIWPEGAPQPTTSSLNWVAGQTISNQVTVKLGAGGRISVYNLAGNVDVVIDVAGYYGS